MIKELQQNLERKEDLAMRGRGDDKFGTPEGREQGEGKEGKTLGRDYLDGEGEGLYGEGEDEWELRPGSERSSREELGWTPF